MQEFKMKVISDVSAEQLETLRNEHDDVYVLEADTGDKIVVRPPTRAHYRRFKTAATNDKKQVDATENLVRDCLVYPTSELFNALLESRPALSDIFGAAVLELAGAANEARVKKL